jgi:organic hydroperoxide reductase OsmC/OhrA
MALVAANAVTRKVAMEKVTGVRLKLRPKKLLKRLKMVLSLKLSREKRAQAQRGATQARASC